MYSNLTLEFLSLRNKERLHRARSGHLRNPVFYLKLLIKGLENGHLFVEVKIKISRQQSKCLDIITLLYKLLYYTHPYLNFKFKKASVFLSHLFSNLFFKKTA